MSDPQRGAYTPPQDVPLQFDPRSPASRRPMPMALIASGTLLVVLIAAVAMYYSRGVRGDNEPPRPVGEPVAALKSAPAAGAQPNDPSAGVDVYAAQNVPGKAPVFAAAPELPKPRPLPAPAQKLTVQSMTAGEMNKPEAPPAPVIAAAAPAKAPVVKLAPAPVVAAQVESAAPAKAQVAAKSVAVEKTTTTNVAKNTTIDKSAKAAAAKTVVASTAATETKAAAAAGGVRVQIGAFSSAALADKGFSDVAALLPGSMSGHAKHVEPVDKDGSTLYRTSVTGFSDRAAAVAFCEALKAKGKICFVKS
jgi:hypothetical protein